MPDDEEPTQAPQPRAPHPLAGVLRDLGRLRARVEAVEAAAGDGTDLGPVWAKFEAVGESLDAIDEEFRRLDQERRAAKPPPIWWPALNDEDYAKLRPALRTWLRDVLAARYPKDTALLAKCWERHPVAVDALTKAWLTWQSAEMNPAADVRDAADWQLRYRSDLVDLAARDLASCRDNREHEGPEPLDDDLLRSFEP